MISVDRVYKTVLTLANSDIRGNVTPAEFKLVGNDAVQEIYSEYLGELNRMLNRENRGLINGGIENLPDRVREQVQHFSKSANLTYVNPVFNLPADCRYIDGVYYDKSNRVDIMKNPKEFRLVGQFRHTLPSEKQPIGLIQGASILISPDSIDSQVSIDYLRNPLVANWTYTVVANSELYNPSASDHQDFDLHPSEENNLVVRILQRFGINLKETDIQATTASEKAQDFNAENQS